MNTNTSTNTSQSSWSDIKAKIKTKWSKFSDSDIDGFKDNLDKVSSQIQKTYGIAKEQAEREFNEFKKTIEATVTPKVAPTSQPEKPGGKEHGQATDMVSEGGHSPALKAV